MDFSLAPVHLHGGPLDGLVVPAAPWHRELRLMTPRAAAGPWQASVHAPATPSGRYAIYRRDADEVGRAVFAGWVEPGHP